MIIYLYKKTHNKTGLRYLGKTESNPYTYSGSGKYWLRHLKKYGNDITTEILRECKCYGEVMIWGSYYSNLWNVVKDHNWANLVPETGTGSGSHFKGKKKSREVGEKISKTIKSKKVGKAYKQTGSNNHMFGKTGNLHHRYGVKHTEKTRKLISEKHHDVSGKNNPRARKIRIVTNTGEVFDSIGNLSDTCAKLHMSINTAYAYLSTGKTTFVKGKHKGYKIYYLD